MDNAIAQVLTQVLVWLAALALLALLYQQGFEDLISQLIIERITPPQTAGVWRKRLLGWIKPAQPLLVLLIACAFSIGLRLDFVTTLNSVIKVLPAADVSPETLQLTTGFVVALAAMFVHQFIPSADAKKNNTTVGQAFPIAQESTIPRLSP